MGGTNGIQPVKIVPITPKSFLLGTQLNENNPGNRPNGFLRVAPALKTVCVCVMLVCFTC